MAFHDRSPLMTVSKEPKADHAPKSSFEENLKELQAMVEQLERGDLPLEDALQTFERGVNLTRLCQKELSAAEKKVALLLKKDHDQAEIKPF